MPQSEEQTKRKIGRPSKFSQELAAEICQRIAEGESLRSVCRDERIPTARTIFNWMGENPSFLQQYTRAKEDRADTHGEEIVELADMPPKYIIDDKGIERVDHGFEAWRKTRIDARKWTASKLKPKSWGDRVQLAGDADNPLKIDATIEADETFKAILQNLELRKQADE
jgi:hypothetical protein